MNNYIHLRIKYENNYLIVDVSSYETQKKSLYRYLTEYLMEYLNNNIYLINKESKYLFLFKCRNYMRKEEAKLFIIFLISSKKKKKNYLIFSIELVSLSLKFVTYIFIYNFLIKYLEI